MTEHLTPSLDDAELLGRRLDDMLLHLRGLVLVRTLLADRGATQPELDSHSAQVHRLRNELADMFRDGPRPGGPTSDLTPTTAPARRAAVGTAEAVAEGAQVRIRPRAQGTRGGPASPASRLRVRA